MQILVQLRLCAEFYPFNLVWDLEQYRVLLSQMFRDWNGRLASLRY